MIAEDVHGLHNGSIVTLAAADIVSIRSTLEREHESDITELSHLLSELVGDQRGVGIQTEEAVIVLLGELEYIIHAHSRLTACHHVKVSAELLALGDDLVHVLEGEISLVAVCT